MSEGVETRGASSTCLKCYQKMSRKLILAVACLALCGLSLVMVAGCQPATRDIAQGTESGKAEVDESRASSGDFAVPGDFTQADAGVWSDTQYATSMNAGNRGCNACHADLFSVLPEGEVGSHEVYKEASYGRVYTYNDCITCHVGIDSGGAASGGAGMYMATAIHGYHYGNQEFLDKGNCFSCHEVDTATGQLGMWDQLKYSKLIGLGTTALGTETWIGGRGYSTNTVTGGVVEADIKLDGATVDQDPSDPQDLYGATNMDFPEVDNDTYTVAIKGVKNEKSFTLDELRTLPQETVTFTEMCFTNGQNGGFYITNITATGVLVSTVIEECGGLVDGTTCFGASGYDGWSGPATPNPTLYALDYLDPNAMIALQYWGEDIDPFDGGPALFVVPGAPAMTNSKWVSEINFLQGEHPEAFTTVTTMGLPSECAGWFSPATDGQTIKLGETLTLEGYAFALPEQQANAVDAIEISADYGETWTRIDAPTDYDEDQWLRFSADWTPKTAGTYCLTVHCDSAADIGPANDGHVLVTVTE